MSLFSFFRSSSKSPAVTAKERLQIVMAHERVGRTGPDYLPMLQQELLAVIAKYVDIDENKVEVKLDRAGDFSTLEVNIELPAGDSGKASDARPANAPGQPAPSPAKAAASGGAALTNGGIKGRR